LNLFVDALDSCENVACVRKKILDSRKFRDKGISNRPFVLKRIENGEPVLLKQN